MNATLGVTCSPVNVKFSFSMFSMKWKLLTNYFFGSFFATGAFSVLPTGSFLVGISPFGAFLSTFFN